MMRKLTTALLLILALPIAAQSGVAVSIRSGTVDPGTCSLSGRNVFFNRTTAELKMCSAANTWSSISGNTIGAASSTDDAVARFDGTGGKTLQNSVLIVTDAGVTSGISTLQTSGNLGVGVAPSATAGDRILAQLNGDQGTRVRSVNTEAAGTGAFASFRAEASTATINAVAYGAGFSGTSLGSNLANMAQLLSTAGSIFTIGTTHAADLVLGAGGNQGMRMAAGSNPTTAFGANAPDGFGRLQGQMGASTGNVKIGGAEWYSVTEVGNVGTGEDALIPAYTILAAALTNDGSSIHFTAGLTFANNANVKRVRVRWIEGANNNVIYDAGAAAIITNSEGELKCTVIRESATVFKSLCAFTGNTVSGVTLTDFATGTYTFANAGTIAVTAEATSNNDVVMEMWKGWWSPTP